MTHLPLLLFSLLQYSATSMAKVERSITFEESWAYLQEAFDNVTSMADGTSSYQVTSEAYMSYYTTVYNACTTNPSVTGQFYNAYKTSFEDYITSKILPPLKQAVKDDIVASVDKAWSKCEIVTLWFARFLNYLSRSDYLQQNHLPSIEETSYLCFYDKVYGELNDPIKEAIVAMIRHERMGNQVDKKLLKNVLGIYKNMADTNQYANHTKNLEEAIFKDAADFYSNKALEWTATISSDEDYMLKELLNKYGRKHISPRAAMKVDISKAFDSISHEFNIQCLHKMNFPDQFIGLIKECITTATYSVNLNGSLRGHFPGGRGLRQGCPLSPPLFVIAMEYLTKLLQFKTSNPEFNHHPKCTNPAITHLAFADDLLLLCRGDLCSIKILKDALDDFGEASGLRINPSKSRLFTGGMKDDEITRAINIIGMETGTLPFLYLGVPIGSSRLLIRDYLPLIHKVTKRVQSWNARTLSYAGRAQLVKAVLFSINHYWSTMFLLPTKIISTINRIIRSYFWSGVENSKRALVAWKVICSPKTCGGLQFPDLLTRNKVAISRLIYDIDRDDDNIWIQWIKKHTFKGNCNIWNCRPKTHHSAFWKSLLTIRDDFLALGGTGSMLANPNGSFSHKNVYNIFTPSPPHGTSNPPLGTANPFRAIWIRSNIPKCCYVAWLAAHKRLPTLARIKTWNTTINDTCWLCKSDVEDDDHLWLQCSYGSLVLDVVSRWTRTSFPAPYLGNIWNWLSSCNTQRPKLIESLRIASIISFIYHVWTSRNNLIYNNQFTRAIECAANIISSIKSHFEANWKDRSAHSLQVAGMLQIRFE